ncbi:Hpt domain-containing protein [Pseudarthrobacter sp. H2]|uniref:Hpt domain-containing protein n=1 Tax=Pseudarthrobacter sp. H2 TaxID=3418415 RepID=UPI003CF5E8DB
MSFLATAPDDGHAGTYPGPEASARGAGPAEGAAPLVDPATLQELGAQLDNPVVANDFARDYARMWDHRYRSLAAALDRGDAAGSLDAVLSLKISSAMVGGLCLAGLAGELEDAIRCGDMDRARSFLPEVADRGRETVDELQAGHDVRES